MRCRVMLILIICHIVEELKTDTSGKLQTVESMEKRGEAVTLFKLFGYINIF